MINGLPTNALDILRAHRDSSKAELDQLAGTKAEIEEALVAVTQRGYRLTQLLAKIDVAIEKLSESEGK